MNTDEFKQVGKSKKLRSFWNNNSKILYFERQEDKGTYFPIYKNELYHLSRVLMRVQQNELHRRIKK